MAMTWAVAKLGLLCALAVFVRGERENIPGQKDDSSETLLSPEGASDVIELRIPGARPSKHDDYLCVSRKIPDGGTRFIVNFEPLAKASIAHHLLLYRCDEPVVAGPDVWECAVICKKPLYVPILYAWGKNAPPVHMPKDVGFEINSGYFVLQIHYLHAISESQPSDNSGVRLTITPEKQKFKAGIFLLYSNTQVIPAHEPKVHADISCRYTGVDIHPFAFRVHAHSLELSFETCATFLGQATDNHQCVIKTCRSRSIHHTRFKTPLQSRVVSGYDNQNGTWHLIGKGNPAWPQAFYPVEDIFTVKDGDILIGRCTYDATDRDTDTNMGATHLDEMCNFYTMYYTDVDHGEAFGMCGVNQFPDAVALLPPGNDVPLPRNPLLESKAAGGMDEGNGGGGSDVPSYDGHMMAAPPGGHTMPRDGHMMIMRGTKRMLTGIDGGGWYRNDFRSKQQKPDYENPYEYNSNDGTDEDPSNYFYYEVANQRNRGRNRGYDPDSEGGYASRSRSGGRTGVSDNVGRTGGSRRGNYDARSGNREGNFGRVRTAADRRKMLPPDGVHVHATRTNTRTHTNSPRHPEVGHPEVGHGVVPPPKSSSISVVDDWLKIEPSDKLVLGQVSGIATDSKGNLHVFHRVDREWGSLTFDADNRFNDVSSGPIKGNTLVVIGEDGHVIKQWGNDMFYMPHGLHVDKDDNVWLTDVAMHQVFRIASGETSPNLILGEKLVHGSDDTHFCQPTDVTTLSTGEFFVTDGYCNARVMKFSKDGKLLRKWGTQSNSVEDNGFPPLSSFDLPHSVTALEDIGLVCVADRSNGRIQCFDLDGKFVRDIHPEGFGGTVYGVEYGRANGLLFAVNGPDPYNAPIMQLGFALDPSTGMVLETFRPRSTNFTKLHSVAVSPSGNAVYVSETGPNKLWKFSIADSHFLAHKSVKKGGVDGGVSKTESKITPVKKTGPAMQSIHPVASDNDLDTKDEKEVEKESGEEFDFGASMVIAALLVVPVFVMVVIMVAMRLRKRGRLTYFDPHGDGSNRRFNIGKFFNRHQGFDRLNTEDSDHELEHLENDSEVDEFTATTGTLRA